MKSKLVLFVVLFGGLLANVAVEKLWCETSKTGELKIPCGDLVCKHVLPVLETLSQESKSNQVNLEQQNGHLIEIFSQLKNPNRDFRLTVMKSMLEKILLEIQQIHEALKNQKSKPESMNPDILNESTTLAAEDVEEPRVIPEVRLTSEKSTYSLGTDIVLRCEVTGYYPEPTVEWNKDGVSLKSMDRVKYLDNHIIKISRAEASDSGHYGCDAITEAGRETSTTSVSVTVEEGVFIHPNCTDNVYFANCKLIVKARYCTNKYYTRFCCRSCTLAGQLPGLH